MIGEVVPEPEFDLKHYSKTRHVSSWFMWVVSIHSPLACQIVFDFHNWTKPNEMKCITSREICWSQGFKYVNARYFQGQLEFPVGTSCAVSAWRHTLISSHPEAQQLRVNTDASLVELLLPLLFITQQDVYITTDNDREPLKLQLVRSCYVTFTVHLSCWQMHNGLKLLERKKCHNSFLRVTYCSSMVYVSWWPLKQTLHWVLLTMNSLILCQTFFCCTMRAC